MLAAKTYSLNNEHSSVFLISESLILAGVWHVVAGTKLIVFSVPHRDEEVMDEISTVQKTLEEITQ